MILAVESSCDETAVAIVDDKGFVYLDFKYSQIKLHEEYGGVVPELASRSHFEVLGELQRAIQDTFDKKNISPKNIRIVAATLGPGLIGPLLVGSSFAKGLALGWKKDFVGVHHLRGHVASVLLGIQEPDLTLRERAKKVFPAWVLLVSGGHCLLLESDEQLKCKLLKTTSDDAAGECFDKCAKMLGLPYPGGPSIEAQALLCSASDLQKAQIWAKSLPRPKSAEGFSFAGLKTAFRLLLESLEKSFLETPSLRSSSLPPLCRALEISIADSLLGVLEKEFQRHEEPPQRFVCCGGVSANLFLRSSLQKWCLKKNMELFLVPLELTTDNAVMIALAAHLQSSDLNVSQVFARGPL